MDMLSVNMEEIDQAGLELADDVLNDWVVFAEEVLGVYLDDEQKEVLKSVQHNPKTTVCSGTSRGKDFVSAVAAMCFMYSTPLWGEKGELIENTKIFLIGPTARQVEEIMFPEISRLFRRANDRGFSLPGRLVGLGIKTDWEEWFMSGFKADDKSVESWTGLHAANIMFVVTEASGLPQLVFDGIEGNLHGNYRFLIVFNDNNGVGYASDTQKKNDWNKFRLDNLNAPNVVFKDEIEKGTFQKIAGQVEWSSVNEKVRDWCSIISPEDFSESAGDFYWENENGRFCYRPNDLFRVKVRGMSPLVSSAALVPQLWIDLAKDRWSKFDGNKTANLRLGVDIAGMGRDSSSFCFRYGNYIEKFRVINSGGEPRHMEMVGHTSVDVKANYNMSLNKRPQVFVDTVGEGAGVYSRLLELKRDESNKAMVNTPIHSVKNGESAKRGDRTLKDITGQYEFKNMRAYLYWCVRDWLNPDNHAEAMLPPDQDYMGLTKLMWNLRSDGSIELEKKEELIKRLKRSPDVEDSIMVTFFPVSDIQPKTNTERKSTLSGFH